MTADSLNTIVTIKFNAQYHEYNLSELDIDPNNFDNAQLIRVASDRVGSDLTGWTVDQIQGAGTHAGKIIFNIRPDASYG